jgi:putative membrane protein
MAAASAVVLAVFPAVVAVSAVAVHRGGGKMKDLAQKLLNEKEKAQVEAAAQAAEKRTSGEIVCMIVSSSYHYPMSNVIGATALALPLALILTPLAGAWLWLGTQNMWLFLGIFTILFIGGYFAVKHSSALKRVFVSRKEMDIEVEEAAVTHFFQHGLYRTREKNGILLFISVFEHKVWILADQGINEKVPEGHWDAIVSRLTEGIRRRQTAAAICRAINTIGEELKQHFPARSDDTDELQNLIIEKNTTES